MQKGACTERTLTKTEELVQVINRLKEVATHVDALKRKVLNEDDRPVAEPDNVLPPDISLVSLLNGSVEPIHNAIDTLHKELSSLEEMLT